MIRFVSIKAFRKSLASLLNVKHGVYAGVPSEICKAFQDVSIEQIRSNRDMILLDDDAIIIKLRLPDKRQHLSKSDGYRLIYLVQKNIPIVGFLTVYPKRGPLQKLDIDDNELRNLVAAFVNEFKSREIVIHDINDNLQEITINL